MTLLDLLDRTTVFFERKKIESARIQAEHLVARVLKKKRLELYLEFDRTMQESELDELRPLVKRRADGEPLQHILGDTEFYGLRIQCDSRALIPRPESEILVEKVLDTLEGQRPGTLVDVGTGTGCLALACSRHLPDWNVIGTDISNDAIALARENQNLHPMLQVEWRQGSLLESLDQAADAIIANLPYLTDIEIGSLPPEVTYDPKLALAGGSDGLDLIRQLCENISSDTKYIFLEAGISHNDALKDLLQKAGFSEIEVFPDLNRQLRFAYGTR
ncbi:MAG: peptide chain release factor N(5)-glutamine methyltransferase [Verrucomicrobiota bacterium]